MRCNSLTTFKAQFRRWVVLGALILTFTGLSGFSALNASVMAAPFYNFPVVAASSVASQAKGQMDKVDRAVGDVKGKLESAAKDTAKKAKNLAAEAKGKAREDVAKTRTSVKDAQSAAVGKVKRDVARTQEGAENAKSAIASRAKQDTSKTNVALEQAGNKAEEFASNVLDTAKNILGQ
jgi:ElaB/YqjD/DUF883 family membrane-anchored ribosome-binding protein